MKTAKLFVEKGKSDSGVIIIESVNPYIIGRSEGSDITFENPYISRNHSEITFCENNFVLKDLNSKNGPLVNNQKVSETGLKLSNCDKISLSNYENNIVLVFWDNEATVTLKYEPNTKELNDTSIFEKYITIDKLRNVYIKKDLITPPLSSREFNVFEFLYLKEGQTCSRDQISFAGWPEREGDVSDQEIDKVISRIRNRLEDNSSSNFKYIYTHRGYGYSFKNIDNHQS